MDEEPVSLAKWTHIIEARDVDGFGYEILTGRRGLRYFSRTMDVCLLCDCADAVHAPAATPL